MHDRTGDSVNCVLSNQLLTSTLTSLQLPHTSLETMIVWAQMLSVNYMCREMFMNLIKIYQNPAYTCIYSTMF